MSNSKKTFKVDARTLIHLGRGSIRDHTTALVELIKNSYDADATNVELEIMNHAQEPYIRIADNGEGMTEDTIDNYWLRIGFSEKTTSKYSSKFKRRRTGEKGIGRISADRLGSILELHTKATGEKPFGLQVDWDDFDVKNRTVEDIPLTILNNFQLIVPPQINGKPSISGTELIIKRPRQIWTEKDLINLSRELSLLFSPFSKINNFSFSITTDVADFDFNSNYQINASYAVKLDLHYDSSNKYVTYTIHNNTDMETKEIILNEKTHLDHIVSDNNRVDFDFDFGSFSIVIYFYPRNKEILVKNSFSLSDLKTFLDNNSGIGIYRDSVRVKPYGLPNTAGADWLDLGTRFARNPAGASRKGFRIRPYQLVGAVFIGRDTNKKLIDSSAREGLIEGPAFEALRQIVTYSVELIESYYHKLFKDNKDAETTPSNDVKNLNQDLQGLQQDLKIVRQTIPMGGRSRDIDRTLDRLDVVLPKLQHTISSIEELASQTTLYRGLATIGIAASIFSHETQMAISSLSKATTNAYKFLQLEKLDRALKSMEAAASYANRISSWGHFTLDRLRRDKRRRKKINIKHLILEICDLISPMMNIVNIDLQLIDLEDIETKTFAMDIEAIVVNLLMNAYSACKAKQHNRIIQLTLKQVIQKNQHGFEIIVTDSGSGIDPKHFERIWEPLFTTKSSKAEDEVKQQAGTGLGLSIVDSIVSDLGGTRSVSNDIELKGARFRLWLPIQR